MGEERLRGFRMVLHRTDVSAIGQPNGDRHLDVAIRAAVHLGELRGDLIEAGEDKTVELDLGHWAVPAHCHTDARTDDPGFGQR
jgi:hypothetical protein